MNATILEETKPHWLDRPVLAIWRLDLEKTLYLVIIVLAIFSRFWNVGDRVMSHDESLHTYYSWNLYKGNGFSHTPLMHGAFKFILNAGIYSLFGADDFTARSGTALFGVLLVLLPFFLRRWLGRTGALFTSFLILISPSLLYHARYIRDEAFMLVWIVLIIWAMFAYLRERKSKWLYLIAIVMGLMYNSMEAAFIFSAIFGLFLATTAIVELSARRKFWSSTFVRVVVGFGAVAIFAGLVVIIQTLLLNAIGFQPNLPPGSPSPFPQPPAPLQPGLPIEFSAQLQYIAGMLGALVKVLLGVLIPTGVIFYAAYRWFKYILPDHLRESSSVDLAVIILTLSLFMASAGALAVLNPVWQAMSRSHLPFVDVKFFTDGNFPTTDVGNVLRLAVLFGAFVAVAAAIGLWWNPRKWSLSAGIFTGIGVTLFTTVFTNGVGLGTGFVGSLGYWLDQQAVKRGSQPLYYYFVITPFYEYLPMLVAFVAVIFYSVRWLLGRRSKERRSPPPWDQRLFVPFLIWWTFACWLAFSIAGEKMPWLMVYLALPMIVLSGRFLGPRLEKIDWRAFMRDRHWLLGFLLAVAVVSGAEVVGNVRSAFGGLQLDSLVAFSSWLGALIVYVLTMWGLFRLAPRPTRSTMLRIAGLIVLLVLVVLTIHTAWLWNYINYDSALEFGVYAHGGAGVKIALKEIQELSQRTVGGNQIQIRYDADASWPWVWYLRDFPNKTQISNSPSRSDLDAPIILGSGKNWSAMDAVLRVTHTQVQYHRIWWPMEDYKTFTECPVQETGPDGKPVFISAYDENGDGQIDAVEQAQGEARCRERSMGILWNWFVADPQRRTALLDIFLNRDYARYDQIRTASQPPNSSPITHTPDNWPLVDDFRLYVKRDLQAQIWSQSIGGVSAPEAVSIDPYAKGFKDVVPLQVWGGAIGSGPGQMTAPHGIAVAPDGSIYVADSLNHRIEKFDSQGQFVMSIGGPSGDNNPNPQPGTFREPWGVAVAPDNSLYVADTWNYRMQKFTPDGALIQVWGVNTDTVGTAIGGEGGFYGPRGVAVDAAGRVIVADTGNKRVEIFDANGQFVSQFGGGGLQPGQLDEPVGIAVDPKGNIVVADTWNGRVQVFDSNGQSIASWDINGWLDKEAVGKPYLAVDQQQRVYVSDAIGRRILVFDITGKYLGGFGQYATDATGFSLPSGIAVDKEGYIYVVDTDTARILKYPPFQP